MKQKKQSDNTTPNRESMQDKMQQKNHHKTRELRDEASLPDEPGPTIKKEDLEEDHLENTNEDSEGVQFDPQSRRQQKRSGL